jgi:phosphoenolpyruvate carboxykinase (GTP)
VASEGTAAAENKVGELRRDPFAMLPFCGYNMGDYFSHWIALGESRDAAKLPRIFFVNWFRKDQHGKFMWPGFGDNVRVLKWIFQRLEGQGEARETAIGLLPAKGALDVEGLDIAPERLEALFEVDPAIWNEEAALIPAFYERFGDRLPPALWREHQALLQRLNGPQADHANRYAAATTAAE